MKVRTETLPSDEAQARIGPSSCGAHAMALTVQSVQSSQPSRADARWGKQGSGEGQKKRTAGRVEQVLLYFCPAFVGRVVLLPDEDLAVERARGEDRAERGVGPREGVDGAVVTVWGGGE